MVDGSLKEAWVAYQRCKLQIRIEIRSFEAICHHRAGSRFDFPIFRSGELGLVSARKVRNQPQQHN
ncbi:hypothetical protein AU476_01775 [Cupriavidus sp. UYMSc13B]|nr:hypothetical protein AU476_01775 [Cupriavidus sp. UYMSc13B]